MSGPKGEAQSGETHQPGLTGDDQRLSLSSCNGSRSIDPAPDHIEQTLRRLSVENWFAIMKRDDGWWIQVGYGQQAGTRPGWYALERRDGSAEHHYRTVVSNLNEVIEAFQQYAHGGDAWTRRFAWNKLQT